MATAYAVVPSWLRALVLKGSEAETTSGALPSAPTRVSTLAFSAGSESFAPAGARTTTRAVAPSTLIVGNFSFSRSKAFCDSVPGIENVSVGGGGAVEAANPTPTRTASHSSDTRPRRRKARRPTL